METNEKLSYDEAMTSYDTDSADCERNTTVTVKVEMYVY